MNIRAATKNTKYLSKARSVGADFSPLVVETHGRFHNSFLTLLKRLAGQLNGQADGHHGLSATEMAAQINLDLVKGNAAHAAKVISRAFYTEASGSKGPGFRRRRESADFFCMIAKGDLSFVKQFLDTDLFPFQQCKRKFCSLKLQLNSK